MKRKNKSLGLLCAIFLLVTFFLLLSDAHADTLILNNGRQIQAEQIWEEDGIVKYSLYGSVVGHPKTDVLKIVREGDSNSQANSIGAFFYPWKLGQPINDVIALCQRYDYPLHRDGLLSVNTHFNPQMCLPYITSHHKFNYKSKTLGYPSVYFFEFESTTKRLTSLNVHILKPNNIKPNDFMASIGRSLSREYGQPANRQPNWIWSAGANSVILSNANNAAVIKIINVPVPHQRSLNLQAMPTGPTNVPANPPIRPNASMRNASPSAKAATPNAIDPFGGLLGGVLRALMVPMLCLLIFFGIINYLKIVIQKKVLKFIGNGIKSKKTLLRFAKDFFSNDTTSETKNYAYEKTNGLFTKAEKRFLAVLREIIEDRYVIQGKVRLADLISPESTLDNNQSKWAFRKISQKHVDFVICDKADFTILGVVELDDKSHLRPDRMARDKFVDAALTGAGIPVLHYPVRFNYEPADIRMKLEVGIGLELASSEGGDRFDDRWKQWNTSESAEDDLRWAPPGFKP